VINLIIQTTALNSLYNTSILPDYLQKKRGIKIIKFHQATFWTVIKGGGK
jgi:hypothetical protein